MSCLRRRLYSWNREGTPQNRRLLERGLLEGYLRIGGLHMRRCFLSAPRPYGIHRQIGTVNVV